MDTKSEEGNPGSTGDTRPLTEDEQALLERLRDGGGTAAVGPAAEDSAEYAAAVDADSPVAGSAPPTGSDPLDPVFREPTP
jgi:hypothetical protein